MGQLVVEPPAAALCVGESQQFTATGVADPSSVTWSIDPADGTLSPAAAVGSSITFTAGSVDAPTDVVLTGTFTPPAPADGITGTATILVYPDPCPGHGGGELIRSTIGFQQIGASGANSSQDFFFDFFISRPVPLWGRSNSVSSNSRYFGPRLRWWGDVRLGSYPQQVNSDILSFSQNLASNAGKLQVNQLVQTAEFLTGPEFRIFQYPDARTSLSDSSSRQRFALTMFAGGGAIGPFSPGENATVFQVPDSTTSQYAALSQQFPSEFPAKPADPTKLPKNVAFVPQIRDRFVRQWEGGLRLYTYYAQNNPVAQPLNSAPATVDFSVGQNELVTNGQLRGAVGRFSAFYPFPLGDRAKPDTLFVYFFGEATLAFSKPAIQNQKSEPTNPNTPIFLVPATTNGTPVPLTDPSVLIINVASNRKDVYRIGAGMDLISIYRKLVK